MSSKNKPLKVIYKRSELDEFSFGDCRECRESIIWGRDKATLKMVAFEPKPVGGTEIDRIYRRHFCGDEAA